MFCRAMGIKWYFRNDILPNFCENPAFTPKSKWKLTKGYLSLEVFLSQIKKDFLNWLSPRLITLTFPRRNGKP